MTNEELISILTQLQAQLSETEVVEFKEAKNQYDFKKLGKYFSALSNEANLKGRDCAWLVFGVRDTDHVIVGSLFRSNRPDLDSLKGEIAGKTSNQITFREIYELFVPEGRVILFQIPPAPQGMPVSFEGHWYGRDGENLVPLNIEELERIRTQARIADWSAGIVSGANIRDLDPLAIGKAKLEFIKRNPRYVNELASWDDRKFLDKAKITIQGQITRAAIILLGNDESEHFLSPGCSRIRWNLKSVDNEDRDFEVYHQPFILAVDRIYTKIRNLKYRYMQSGSLFPEEVLRYDPFTIRELLNNCIAHQDYSQGGYINLTEFEDDRLIFSNLGSFIPVSVENVVLKDTPEEYYRNPFLVEAMRNLDMIETQGGGIRKVFTKQRERFFPFPDYDLSDGKVKVTVIGRVLDVNFARILTSNPALSLQDLMLLDKVQKRLPIPDLNAKYLRGHGWIEGRKPNYYLSNTIVASTGDTSLKASYIRNRSFDDPHFKQQIIEYIRKFGRAHKHEISELIVPKLSDALSDKQKYYKVGNLLSALRMEGKIKVNAAGEWKLT